MPVPDTRRRVVALVVAAAVLIAAPLAVVATDAFTDVPDTNVHHNDITWLKDAGVTAGCNPPANTEFCPGDPVLRQQMASFMRRLAENQVVDAATAVEADHATTAGDAGQLGGKSPASYQTLTWHAGCGLNDTVTATSCGPNPDGSLPDQTTVQLLAIEASVPTSGTLAVSVHALTTATLWATLDSTCALYTPPDFLPIFNQMLNGLIVGANPVVQAGSSAVQVAAGTHAIRLCAAYEAADGGGAIVIGNMTATWSEGGTVVIEPAVGSTGAPLDALGLLSGARE